MVIRRNLIILIIVSSYVLLSGCSSIASSKGNEQTISSQSSDGLTIHTVEFSSEENVTNVGVALLDYETREEIDKEMVDENGKAYFGAVLPEKPYEIVVYRITDYGEWMEQTRKQIVYNPMEPIIRIETFNTSVENRLQVPVVLQNPELPNGCEITSLTAILNYYGINVDKMTLSDRMPKLKLYVKNGVRYGPDPNDAYAGDPTSKDEGFYVYAPPLIEVANEILFENNKTYRAMDITDATKEELIDYVKSGVPVLTWVTIDWKTPRKSNYWIIEGTNEKHQMFRNLHAVVMTGYNDGKVTVMNPLNGYEVIDEQTFFKSYEQLGSHAIVIL